MTVSYIGIGSNLGDRRRAIDRAIGSLRADPRITVLRVSSIYETAPVSDIPQGLFLNGVIEIETSLAPRRLLRTLQDIEEGMGRRRTVRNAPREIDLDILLYGDERVDEEGLTVPHPRMAEREFVLRGLRELGVPASAAGESA